MKSSAQLQQAEAGQAVSPRGRRESLRLRLYKYRYFYLFISPFFILFLTFGLFPILFSFVLSFTNWTGLGPMQFVGLRNYSNLITNPEFHAAIGNTLILLLGGRGSLIIAALGLAFLLHMQRPRFAHGFRVIYFLPMLVSSVAVAQIFVALFEQRSGLVNYLLSLILGGQVQIGWFTEPQYAKLLVTFSLWWKYLGWTVVILAASMATIPGDLFDAAHVDGATSWDLFWRIVVPLLRPILLFITISSIIGGFEMFGEVFALWGTSSWSGGIGGPGNAAMTTAVYLYQIAFSWGEYGRGAAVSYLMFLMIAAFSYVNFRIQMRDET